LEQYESQGGRGFRQYTDNKGKGFEAVGYGLQGGRWFRQYGTDHKGKGVEGVQYRLQGGRGLGMNIFRTRGIERRSFLLIFAMSFF